MSTQSNATNYAPYQRLVRAYPGGRRRDELLDTLIMAAADGARSRPTARETLDVLRHAPRARLGRPGSRGVVVAAVMVALLTGLVAGCLAARATASAQHRALPTAAEMAQLGALIAPGVTLTADERYDEPAVVLVGEAQYGSARLIAAHDAATRETRPFTQGVLDRLRQAGWQTDWVTETATIPNAAGDDHEFVVAKKGDVVLQFETTRWGDRPADGHLYIMVQHAPSGWVFVAGAIGAGLGLILGWLLTGWASRRTEEHRTAGGGLGILTAFAVVTMAPLAPDTISQYVAGLSGGPSYTDAPFWGWTVPGDELSLLTAPAVLAIGAAVLTAACRPRRNRPPGTRGARTRQLPKIIGAVLLAAAVAGLLGVYEIGFSLPLLGDRLTLLSVGVTAAVLFQARVLPLRRPGTAESRLDTPDH